MAIRPETRKDPLTTHQATAKQPGNLLDSPTIKGFIKSSWYPGIFQIPAVFIFGLIMYLLLLGPAEIEDNFGSALTWILWWPLIPFFFLLMGRFWCAVCPFATISDWVQKLVGRKKPVPKLMKKYGIWFIDAFFITVVWLDHVYNIVESPRGTGYFLLSIFIGVLIAGILFERRAWCRYLCTIGGMSGNYSRTGMLELRTNPDKCSQCTTKACYNGSDKAPGCPVFEFPRAMDSSANCNLCGYCIKSCPNDSIRLTPRAATKELWSVRRPKVSESFLAAVIMGIVFIQNITMLEIWDPILKGIENFFGTTNYVVTFTFAFIVAMLIPLVLLAGAAAWASKTSKEGLWPTFARFGYAMIPLDLAGHLAHNLLHLFAEGGSLAITFNKFTSSVMNSVMDMGAIMSSSMGMSMGSSMDMAILPMDVIKVMQYLFLAIGVFGSWLCIRKISQNSEPTNSWKVRLPFNLLLAVLGLINFVLFFLPMMERM